MRPEPKTPYQVAIRDLLSAVESLPRHEKPAPRTWLLACLRTAETHDPELVPASRAALRAYDAAIEAGVPPLRAWQLASEAHLRLSRPAVWRSIQDRHHGG